MLQVSALENYARNLSPEQLQSALASLLPETATRAEQISAIEAALRSSTGGVVREQMARLIVERLIPVEALVPPEHEPWRAPVRDAMLFWASRFSDARLAPKILEQLELPAGTPPEVRLLKLITRVPGLQKLGQVLARNRKLRPSVRKALSKLENGIHDVTAEEMDDIIRQELGARLKTFAVKLTPKILSEASVSAVIRFTWRNPVTGRRERGVFKTLKPYIPTCFSEDMDLLRQLAEFFEARHRQYGFAANVLTDTFTKVRRHLQHEVNFPREQASLREAATVYRTTSGVRIPGLIQPLCTPKITALTQERGEKVTDAAARTSMIGRRYIAEQLIEALVAAPLFAAAENAIFHADPHAGNLLYDNETGELILLDWALRERLSYDQRRHLALLAMVLVLRDPVGVDREVRALCQRTVRRNSREARVIRELVAAFLDELPLTEVPGIMHAMLLLERLAVKGIRFPAPLVMFSKVLFTLDGILHDIGGSSAWTGFNVALRLGKSWLTNRADFRVPVKPSDWMAVQSGLLLYPGRIWVQWEQRLVDRILPPASDAPFL